MFPRKGNRPDDATPAAQAEPKGQGKPATGSPQPARGATMNDSISYQPTVAPARALSDIPRPHGDEYPGKPTAPAPAGESRMTVGPEIRLKGEISNCDVLVVEGDVEATLESKVVEVAAGGTFNGTATVESAEIHGDFDGTLTVSDLLRVHGTGRVSGKVRYGKIEVQAGGEVSGDIASASSARTATPVLATENS
ncbi:MAG: polymer-forming cytoskeletal protein [Rhodospirillaceae bacterium]|jgi:cytoskeletal protein CcmA (bactofilin family)